MRIRHLAYISLVALALSGCNDTLETASQIDLSTVKNKVEQPLPARILSAMAAKDMDRNSPIMIRIFKEEGMMEIWKAKKDNRFDKIAEYKICAWSGRLGPKVKEGDRQAPEGFYQLTRANLNPNSKYYLAINTGFPNRYDAVNGRSGRDLMIHGACSSSGCYSMTDQQVLEIYAFARDAFRGGQQTVQLEAFPFRMTAENMVKHRLNPNIEFWKMLKVGYDNFEVTKRPPEVNVCEKKYVFNKQTQNGEGFNPGGKCPASMSEPQALTMALANYDRQYQSDYAKAAKKFDGMAWYDPTEAERKAVVAKLRKGHDLAYAPTGTSLEAGKMVKVAELEDMMSRQTATGIAGNAVTGTTSRPAGMAPGAASSPAASGGPTMLAATEAKAKAETGQAAATGQGGKEPGRVPAAVPVPVPNPLMPQPSALAYAAAPEAGEAADKKPFWKFWSKN